MIEIGLSTCWCNAFPYTKLKESLGLPEKENIVLIMPIGYAADGAEPALRHTLSKDKAEMIRYM